MPELPEVQTTVSGLQKTIVGLTVKDVWSDLPSMKITRSDYRETIKYLPYYKKFKTSVLGTKVISVERRAKNILINLSGSTTILIHMKMTGHLMVGSYTHNKKKNIWEVARGEQNELLRDPYNRFIHVVFSLSNGKQLVFCDARKFGKVTLLDTRVAHSTNHLKHLGPEPLDTNFTLALFILRLHKKLNGKIKTVLMDQTLIAGIGNIYSDEMLWLAGIHPEEPVKYIPKEKMKMLYGSMKSVLSKGIDFGGDSTSDYRDVYGNKGRFSHQHNAYQLTGSQCGKKGCGGVILRKVVGGRSAHFCSKHQQLIKKK